MPEGARTPWNKGIRESGLVHKRVWWFHAIDNTLPTFVLELISSAWGARLQKKKNKSTTKSWGNMNALWWMRRKCFSPIDHRRDIANFASIVPSILIWQSHGITEYWSSRYISYYAAPSSVYRSSLSSLAFNGIDSASLKGERFLFHCTKKAIHFCAYSL